ncbi:uncharacterized protein UBRO_20411 [Ustilago bromivora]|uniref:Reverse transcriptase Ty1/copia-type domain-containing protein n=1 Tax=Ustilago bromivora TaxID=307758 RepID=A0A1K0FVH5_9BASI|nr:uncharacterized protein UBRO_20411 [Ustilago bromivora]
MIQYDDSVDIEHLEYTKEDIHNEEFQEPIDKVYPWPGDHKTKLEKNQVLTSSDDSMTTDGDSGINTFACHMSHPTEQAMQAVLRIVRYLNQTKDEVLRIGGQDMSGNVVKAYTDANWASDPNMDRKSTSGSIVKVYGSIITWNSHVQKCVASSTVEAKYIASSSAAREALFHRHLRGLRFGDHMPTLFTNNTGCIQVAKDPAMHSKLKHVDTKYHLLRDHVQEGDIVMEYVKTNDNVADFLTKPVSQHLLTWTQQHLGMANVAPLVHSVGEGES